MARASVDKESWGRAHGGVTPYIVLLLFIFVCFSASALGALFPPDDWYSSLRRPSFAPPNWLFGPVWTTLYLMMSVSAWLYWISGPIRATTPGLSVFAVQLLLNVLWSPLFFGLHEPGIAFVEICFLLTSILATIAVFHRRATLAAMLLIPYFGWVCFAAVLNYGFWSLNS